LAPAMLPARHGGAPPAGGGAQQAPATGSGARPAPAAVRRAPLSDPRARPSAAGLGSWEEAIGGSWLNRIGVSLLVIGIAFALGYSLTILGPAGKAALAAAVSLAMIVGGVFLERRETYRFYGRGLLAGGWAALYATAYAVHELEATRIVEDPRAGFAILLLVGVGMILHSLRYANQGLTALAYALAYAAIVLHSISAYTLVAATLLGLGTVLHLLRRAWYGVAFGGIAATYGSLLLWYMRQPAMTPETLRYGLGALAVNWVVFLLADFAPEPSDENTRQNARAVALLNAVAASALSYYAWTRLLPGGGWEPLAAFGFAYAFTSSGLRLLGRRAVQPVHSLIAALLLALAAPRRFETLAGATWFWLAEAETLVVIGVAIKDRFHRMLGCILFLVPLAAIVSDQIGARLRQPDGLWDRPRFLLSAAACLCFYFTFARLKAFASSDEAGLFEESIRRVFSYGAFGVVLLALWVQLPAVYVAPAAAVLMLVLFEIAAALSVEDLRVQSYLAAVYAALTALALSAPSTARLAGTQARAPALLLVALVSFIVFMRQRRPPAIFADMDAALRPLFSWAGMSLVALVVWLVARPAVVGPAWMAMGLLLAEAGIALGERHLRRPGYVAVVAALVSLAMSNLTATDRVGGWSIRVLTVTPAILATYYLWWRLRAYPEAPAGRRGDDHDEAFGRALSYLGAALVGLFVRFQFGLDGAALRWSLAMVALFVAGYLLRDADFRLQAYGLAAAVFVRAVGFDFRFANPILGIDGPAVIVNVGVLCFGAAGALIRVRRAATGGARPPDRRPLELEARLEAHGDDLTWLAAVALAAIYLYRTHSGFMLIVAWAIEGLCVTAAGFALKTRSLRLAGLGLLGIGLVMTLYRTFTTFDTLGRIVSFLVLGLVLLLISFAYTRYRGSLRKAP
ncbi:MAG TPA: DUF2339 domain-containing protein, partial [Candidatus Polarisedimenticolia bacterium]|nr:DUF2339 domain-containing protein [Candidatus Polarisedimenticolia bacterium]